MESHFSVLAVKAGIECSGGCSPGLCLGRLLFGAVLGFVAVRRVEGLLSVNDLEMLACGFVCCCKFT